ncbi:predicted protein [Streptomyces sp. SPB78]|nr:predicted protein [Streptomyces sp. SPB78]
MTRTYQVASILPQAARRRSTEPRAGLGVYAGWYVGVMRAPPRAAAAGLVPVALTAEETRE